MHPCFFGYGSLVNRDTHTYAAADRARLEGWRRKWVYTQARGLAFLSVVPDAATAIDGLIAEVPNADWAALDAREHGYARIASGSSVRHPRAAETLISHYSVLREFFATTDGWETPILNDRAAPQYPRAKLLSAQETALVDQHLALRGAAVVAA